MKSMRILSVTLVLLLCAQPLALAATELTKAPAAIATAEPTAEPTAVPTAKPTAEPTVAPTAKPTAAPTAVPTAKPTAAPTAVPTAKPTAKPTPEPTAKPTAVPTAKPPAEPTAVPTAKPTAAPTAVPTVEPTAAPTVKPTAAPTAKPTAAPTAVPTAEPTPTPLAGEVDVTDFVLASDPSLAGSPQRTRPVTPETEQHRFFRFSEDVVLRGIFEDYDYFFSISNYWEPRYALAQLEYTVSPLINDVPASMTFFINDRPIYSCAVEYNGGSSQIVFVEIPLEALRVGFNEFSITGYVRLYDDDGCLDDFSGANWVNVARSSYIEVGYDVIDTHCQISYYPYPMVSSMDEHGSALTIYVPEQPTEEELRTAFMLRADLGDEISDSDEIAMKTLAHYGESKGNALIIAREDRLPAQAAAQLPQGAQTFNGALVYEYVTAGGWTMAVTARVDTDLHEAAAMLMDADRVVQEKNAWAFVPAGSSDGVVIDRSLSALINNGETIKGITDQDGLNFVGPFHQEAIIYLPLSGGFVLGEGGKIELKMRYSDNLDFDRSLVTVYWGETPVASRKLERERAGGDTFSFMMPSDVVGTHAASVKIAFDLEIKELYCTKRADEMPWAYISGDSTLYLPAGGNSTFDLSLRPYPFQQLSRFNDLAVVVPERMTDAELSLFGRIAALYGSEIKPYGSLQVWFDGDYPLETENRNVIVMGTWKDNATLRALNDALSFRFSEDGSRFESSPQTMLSERYAENVAALQLIRSPYQQGRAILAACAVNDAALSQIDRYCSVVENNWALAGDAFLIDSDLDTKDYRFMEEQQPEPMTLRERIEAHRDAVMFTLISTGAMLLLLIAVLLILLRYRHNRHEEVKK